MRIVNRLTEKQVRNAKPGPGKFVKRLLDGNGLYLQATLSKTGGVNRNWLFRYEIDGRRRDMGLGSLLDVGLAAAREEAKALREQIVLKRIDPLDQRRAKEQAERADRAKTVTFRECTERYLDIHEHKWRNAKHAFQWRATLASFANPVIGDMDVRLIETAHCVSILQPIWRSKHVTATRLRGRIEAVIGWSIAAGFRPDGPNPARWSNHLQALLGGVVKNVEHHAAMPFDQVPAFMVKLRGLGSPPAAALEFAILTAARTSEVMGATWDEIDLKNKVWTIPASRMKAGREHRVPLCDRAVDLLLQRERKGDFVFGSPLTGKRPHHATLSETLKGIDGTATVHGFRSSFRDWCSEKTSFAKDTIEMALAHAIANQVEAAYRRGDLFEKRRKLMEAWAGFLAKPAAEAGNVVAIGSR